MMPRSGRSKIFTKLPAENRRCSLAEIFSQLSTIAKNRIFVAPASRRLFSSRRKPAKLPAGRRRYKTTLLRPP